MRTLCAALAAAFLLPGCVVGNTGDGGAAERDLAARPSSLAPEPTDTAPPSASGSATSSAAARPPGSPAATAGSSGGPSGSARPPASGTAAPAAPYHQVGVAADASGDAGTTTPAYGDVVRVTIEDNGTNARITMTMRGTVPAALPSNETMGAGVDLYSARTQLESDYQVFADGESDGWYAYLTGPQGRVRYPGTFGLGGRRLVFTIPWSALGGRTSGYFSAFADWTRSGTPNLSGEDHAPDLGYATYDRS